MKNFVFIFALLSIIFITSINSFSEELRGPKIFGLQLGMPIKEAQEALKNLCVKDNSQIDTDNSMGYSRCNSLSAMIMWNKQKNYINLIVLLSQVFNYDTNNNVLSEEFLNRFMNKYNIPELKTEPAPADIAKYTKFVYVYANNQEGWKIIINPRGSFRIEEITKASDYKFE